MSVSLNELLIHAGYDIRHNKKDMEWFLGLESEFEELLEATEEELERLNEEEEENDYDNF